jgi:hypothetical protein
MNALLKVTLGAGVAIALWTLVDDLLALVQVFMMVIIIPMMFFTSIGLFSQGTYEIFAGATVGSFQKLRDRIDHWKAKLQEEEDLEEPVR